MQPLLPTAYQRVEASVATVHMLAYTLSLVADRVDSADRDGTVAVSAHGTAVAYGRQTVLYGGGVPKPYSQQAAKLLPERVSLSEQFGFVSASQDGLR